MPISTFVFWILALITVGSAVMTVCARNILHAAFALCLCFMGVAGLYVFLHADFLAAVQLIVYVGGILVLIMFAIMFSSNMVEDTAERGRRWVAMTGGGITAIATLAALVLINKNLYALIEARNAYASVKFVPTVSVGASGATAIGHLLMGQYLLPFEFASVLLLATLVGAVVIVRKELR